MIQVTKLSTPRKYQSLFSLPGFSIQLRTQLEMKNNKLFLESNGVRVWIIPQALSNVPPLLQEILSTKEMERANRYCFYRDHTRFLNRRGIARLILGNYLEIHPRNIKFEYTKLGKPYIKDRSPIKFSLSSSGEYACLAVSSVNVGVDIEKITPFENLDEISKRIIPQSIFLDIKDSHERLNIFYKCWTRMEAVLKAKGTGFFHNRRDWAGDYIQDGNDLPELRTWKILDVPSPINYAVAICLACNWDNINLRYWEPRSCGVDISSVEQFMSSYTPFEEEIISDRNFHNEIVQLDMMYQC